MPPIKFGMFPNTQGTPDGTGLVKMIQRAVAEAQAAERYDFDGAFLTEHHQDPSGYLPAPLITAAAVAAKTERITIGTAVLLLPLYHPVQVAEQAAVVDLISNGRLILGVGLGYQPEDFQTFGVPIEQRVSHFEEGIQILRGAWAQDNFSFSGRRFRVDDLSLSPKPVQQPAPIWIGASSNPAVER
ncbi:MAG TPA: LLM class flavin-dependent oxidoreductase, partial [Dehalococcoidia bacterium]|nr:LLM class flavin-dependent oxidoreductase [Dehalococcoidia bacterium]